MAKPTKSLKIIANKSKKNSVNVLIVGDKKSPKNFRLKNQTLSQSKKHKTNTTIKAISYMASYGYILLVLGITHYIDFHNSL